MTCIFFSSFVVFFAMVQFPGIFHNFKWFFLRKKRSVDTEANETKGNHLTLIILVWPSKVNCSPCFSWTGSLHLPRKVRQQAPDVGRPLRQLGVGWRRSGRQRKSFPGRNQSHWLRRVRRRSQGKPNFLFLFRIHWHRGCFRTRIVRRCTTWTTTHFSTVWRTSSSPRTPPCRWGPTPRTPRRRRQGRLTPTATPLSPSGPTGRGSTPRRSPSLAASNWLWTNTYYKNQRPSSCFRKTHSK